MPKPAMPSTQTKEKKAGIVVLKEDDGSFMVLGLRYQSSYDLPKGTIDPGESVLDAALRETEEEAHITELDFRWGLQTKRIGNTTFFVATTNQKPMVAPNPTTGELEHDAAHWLTLDQAEHSLHLDLQPIVEWIRNTAGEI
jgi:8-oxo-dGTP pyrophosphatase MutT (NUDIX family)